MQDGHSKIDLNISGKSSKICVSQRNNKILKKLLFNFLVQAIMIVSDICICRNIKVSTKLFTEDFHSFKLLKIFCSLNEI